jgi:MSHA pilin protein MshD
MCINQPVSRQSGISLIELIMFIVIVSIALAGILLGMNQITGHSADTMLRKQALTAAESLLEGIEAQPFSNIQTQVNSVNGTPIPGLAGYSVTAGLDTATGLGGIAGASAVIITVTLTDSLGNQIVASGYRTAYY